MFLRAPGGLKLKPSWLRSAAVFTMGVVAQRAVEFDYINKISYETVGGIENNESKPWQCIERVMPAPSSQILTTPSKGEVLRINHCDQFPNSYRELFCLQPIEFRNCLKSTGHCWIRAAVWKYGHKKTHHEQFSLFA